MKTIVISDIQGNEGTILPYALRMGRAHETEVDILHAIDPRKQQGSPSPRADSQSITPGAKLSHEDILRREKNNAKLALEKYISGEGSRLNYPLKINLLIEEGSVESLVKNLEKMHPGCLFMASTDPANSMVEDLDELLEMARIIDSPVCFIPPGYSFREPGNVMMLNDFDADALEPFKAAVRWLKPFPAGIHAFGMANGMDRLEMDMRRSAWKNAVSTYVDPPHAVNTSFMDPVSGLEELEQYLETNGADFWMAPRGLLEKNPPYPLPDKSFRTILKRMKVPVLVY